MNILSTTDNATNSGNVSILLYKVTQTPTQPAQRVTVLQIPDSNAAFSRSVQLTSEYLFIKRGTASVGIPIQDLAGIAVSADSNLSYSPLITVQPLAASANSAASNSTNTANFNVSANSETALTYAWRQYNGSAWSANLTNTTIANANYVVTSNTLSITAHTNETNNYGILCIVYNSTGSTNSSRVTLTVT